MRSRWPTRLLTGLAAPLMLAAALTGLGPAAAASAAACQGFISELPQPDSPGTVTNTLSSVTMLSACNVYAVGLQTYTSTTQPTVQPLIEHWDGTFWSVQAAPLPPSDHLHLASIQADSPTDIWAVGGFRDNQGIDRALILHSNGRTWTQVPNVPSPSQQFNDLTSVRAVSPTNAWAVGTIQAGDVNQNLILHWNGTNWTQVQGVPSPGGPGSSDELFGVTATSASNAWAVGNSEATNGNETSLILRWNGTKWAQVPNVPHPGSTSPLLSVAASSATNAWAVGSTSNGGVSKTLALRWNGTKWAQVTTPSPANPGSSDRLSSVTVTSASSAWAVEGASGILHWDGHTWQPVATPELQGATFTLAGINALNASSVWAVGAENAGAPPVRAFAIHCC